MRAKNGLTVWLPKIETPISVRRAINFADSSLRHAMMLQARETYRALGGTDAEWIGRSIPQPPRADEGAGVVSHYIPPEADEDDDRDGLETFLGSKETTGEQEEAGE